MRNGHTTKHPATHRTISARDVSVYILSKLAQDRKLETVKLQRLLWFCQGWHYGAYNTSLFAEDFEAWTLGPVVPAIHHRHPGVHEVSANHDFGGDATRLTNTHKEIVNAVIATYGGMNVFELVEHTRREDTPWFKMMQARRDAGVSEDTPVGGAGGGGVTIPKALIRMFFKKEAKRIRNGGEVVAERESMECKA